MIGGKLPAFLRVLIHMEIFKGGGGGVKCSIIVLLQFKKYVPV